MAIGIYLSLIALKSLSILQFTKSRSSKTGVFKVLIISPLQNLKDIARVIRITNLAQATGWLTIIVGLFKEGKNLIYLSLILYAFYIYIKLQINTFCS